MGNLFNPVERADLERLVESYGTVSDVKIFASHAIVTLECGRQQAEEAIEELDKNFWMDNNIRVMFNNKTPEKEMTPTKYISIEDDLKVDDDIAAVENTTKTFEVFSSFVGKTFLRDMCQLFSTFGTVETSQLNPRAKTLTLVLKLPENKVQLCLSQINGKVYKSSALKVKLVDPTVPEDPLKLVQTSSETFKDEKKVLERTLTAYCNTKAKSFLTDMSDVVFPKFGTIRSCKFNQDGKTISIVMYSSELVC